MWSFRNMGLRPWRTRRIARVGPALGIAALLGGLAGLAACAGEPSAPVSPPASLARVAATTGGTVVNALLWTRPVSEATAGAVIGPEGGSFAIPSGIRVTVPAGAVPAPTAFSVTRLPGNIIAYEFQPHGTTFAVPVQIEHPTQGVDFRKVDLRSLAGAYFPDASGLDQRTGTAVVTEFRPTLLSASKDAVRFSVDHFSGYMVSWGRR